MTILDQLATSQESMKDFQRERLEVELTELICRLMEEHDVSRAELARRLGKSRAYVTKLLRDGSNMTVKTMSDLFFAFSRSLRFVDQPLSAWTPSLAVDCKHISTHETQVWGASLVFQNDVTSSPKVELRPSSFTIPAPSPSTCAIFQPVNLDAA